MLEGYLMRFLASGAAANPLQSHSPEVSKTFVDVLSILPTAIQQKKEKENSIFEQDGSIKNFRETVVQLVKMDNDVAAAQRTNLNPPPGPESQSSSPCLGI